MAENALDEKALDEKALDEKALDEKVLDEKWAHDNNKPVRQSQEILAAAILPYQCTFIKSSGLKYLLYVFCSKFKIGIFLWYFVLQNKCVWNLDKSNY